MSTLSLRLPDSLHRKVRELAAKDDISINQFVATAVAEKMSALLTEDYLAQRAARGSRGAFERVLRRVPDRPPIPGDEWEPAGAAAPRPRSRSTEARRPRKTRRSRR
jgi:predicted transcriptional regulator